MFLYNYFHIDRGLRRRQRIHERSFYCIRKKDFSNSFIENINNKNNDNEEPKTISTVNNDEK
jgi:hypothetical protein